MSINFEWLKTRVKNILLQPKTEWDVIEAEPTTIQDLYKNYIMILAAIPPVSTFIGLLVFGYGGARPAILGLLINCIVSYIFALIGVAVIGLVIEALAPTFSGIKDRTQAFKVAAYSSTASWLAGIFGIIPSLRGIGSLLALYSLYLLYLGLPKLMKISQEKSIPYIILIIVIGLLVTILLAFVAGLLIATGA